MAKILPVITIVILSVILCSMYGGSNAAAVKATEKQFFCYWGTWATYRWGDGKFNVEDIDPFLCTHVVYTFIGILDTGHVRSLDPYLDLEEDWGRAYFKKFNELRLINPKLKTLLAIGGWNEESLNFSIVANDPAKRVIFAEEASNFVQKHGFDGFDLDWEYPGQRLGDPIRDKDAFIEMLKVLKPVFESKNLLLTAAVASAEFSASISYDIPRMAQYLDFVNVMTYDLHGPWDTHTGMNSPIYHDSETDVSPLQRQLNINASVHYWLDQGLPKHKLILGIPIYGRTFRLANANVNHLGAEVNGPGQAGQYTREPGMIGYNEFCELQMQSKWNTVWSEEQHVPYAYQENQWVTYENMESISAKVKYLLDLDLGGAMVWSIETDDFHGLCGGGKNPVLTKINQMLGL